MEDRKSYSELMKLGTFEERFSYLKLNGKAFDRTFGDDRYLNQLLYHNDPEWKRVRREIIIRDNACDLGIPERQMDVNVIVHHINPLTVEEVMNRSPTVYDPENLITVSKTTHNAIHYGNANLLIMEVQERKPNDTCPWRS